MSFLNALASDGLSVGLRFYTAKLNGRTAETGPCAEAAEECGQAQGVATPQESAKTAPVAATKPAPTPEELAAGRAEAKARLTEGGSLGQLQAAGVPAASKDGQADGSSGEAKSPAGEGGAGAASSSAGGGPQTLSSEEEKEVARLKAEDARIQSEAKASGAEGIQYSYTTGPDNGRYISSARGWVTEDGGSAQSESVQFGSGQDGAGQSGTVEAGAAGAESKSKSSGSASPEKDLSEEERQAVQEMKQRDQEVRIHEQAHVAAASGLAGAPVYEYQTGPDGKRYAVGGHVEVQTSGSSDPETALREAEAVKRAATAPADPSGADRAAAASASAEINRLRAEKSSDRSSGQDGQADEGGQGLAQQPTDGRAGEAAKVANGSSFNQQVLGAYAAVKFGTAAQAPRPVLARA